LSLLLTFSAYTAFITIRDHHTTHHISRKAENIRRENFWRNEAFPTDNTHHFSRKVENIRRESIWRNEAFPKELILSYMTSWGFLLTLKLFSAYTAFIAVRDRCHAQPPFYNTPIRHLSLYVIINALLVKSRAIAGRISGGTRRFRQSS